MCRSRPQALLADAMCRAATTELRNNIYRNNHVRLGEGRGTTASGTLTRGTSSITRLDGGARDVVLARARHIVDSRPMDIGNNCCLLACTATTTGEGTASNQLTFYMVEAATSPPVHQIYKAARKCTTLCGELLRSAQTRRRLLLRAHLGPAHFASEGEKRRQGCCVSKDTGAPPPAAFKLVSRRAFIHV